MPIFVKQADGSHKITKIKQKTPEEYEMILQLLEEGHKFYIKDVVERMKKLQEQIDVLERKKDILFEYVSDKDLTEIEERFNNATQ